MSLSIGPPGDIPEIKNVIGFTLASPEVVAGTGGASVLQRLTDAETAMDGRDDDISNIKTLMGFDKLDTAPAQWRDPQNPYTILERLIQLETVTVPAHLDILRELLKKLYNTTDLPTLFPNKFG